MSKVNHKIVKRQYFKPTIDGTWLGNERLFSNNNRRLASSIDNTKSTSLNLKHTSNTEPTSSSASVDISDSTASVAEADSTGIDLTIQKSDIRNNTRTTSVGNKISIRELSLSVINILNKLIRLLGSLF